MWRHYPTPVEAAEANRDDLATLIRKASRGRIKMEHCTERASDIQGTAKIMVLALGKRNPNRWSTWAEDIHMLGGHLEHLNAG